MRIVDRWLTPAWPGAVGLHDPGAPDRRIALLGVALAVLLAWLDAA